MKKLEFITIDEIRKLLRSEFGIPISRAAVYGYIARRGFPKNIGIGCPRLWRRSDVESWISTFKKK